MTVEQILLILGGYGLGAIPFGVIVARRYGVDILAVGSKNPGATNVMRVLGKAPGILVFVLDVLKGYVPAAIGLLVFQNNELGLGAGMAAMIGHSFSPFIKFKGGKGIATGLGMLLGSTPWVALSAFGLFLVIVAISRWISLGSIIAAASMAVFGFVFGESVLVIVALGLMGLFVVVRHKANIGRLLQGQEPKFGQKLESAVVVSEEHVSAEDVPEETRMEDAEWPKA